MTDVLPDLYTLVAARIFLVPADRVSREQRAEAKLRVLALGFTGVENVKQVDVIVEKFT